MSKGMKKHIRRVKAYKRRGSIIDTRFKKYLKKYEKEF